MSSLPSPCGVTNKLIVTKKRNDDEPSNPNSWVAVTIHRDYNHCRDTMGQGGEYLTHTVRQIYSIYRIRDFEKNYES